MRRNKRYWRYLGLTGLTVVGAVVLLLGASGSALATHVDCGDTITTDTKLDSDVGPDCPGNGIVIGAHNITLDLGGHVVDGDDSGGGNGVENEIFGGFFDGVVVKNGQIQDFGVGVRFQSSDGSDFTGLTVTSNIFSGVDLQSSPSGSIVRNSITNNGSFGLILTGSSSMNEVTGNSIGNNGSTGLFIGADSDQNQVTRNSVFSNVDGIAVEDSSVSTDADGNVLMGNSVSSNSGTGLIIGVGAVGTDVIRNDATGNAFDGVFVQSGAINTVLLGNNSSNNFNDGIQVESSATTLRRNVANFNTFWGILAVPGVTDGGGNRAKGNGVGQCLNVSC